MIYDILNNLSQSVRELWQSWNAGGFNFMTLTLLNSAQGSFFYDPDCDSELSANATEEEKIAAKRRKITYSEILTYALPTSVKVIEFNNLVDRVIVSQKQTSFIERDDFATAEAMILLSDILNENWQEFPLKVKVLLLNKLKVIKRSFWQYLFSSPISNFKLFKNRINYYIEFWRELRAYDKATQRNIFMKISKNIESLKNAWNALEKSRLMIFEADGYLLEENKENIGKFNHSLKTMLSARQGIRDYHQTLIELAK